MKRFDFSISCDVSLTVDEIWPDGDAPEDPTVDDVLEVIDKCGGGLRVIRDWDLMTNHDFEVSDDKDSKPVPP